MIDALQDAELNELCVKAKNNDVFSDFLNWVIREIGCSESIRDEWGTSDSDLRSDLYYFIQYMKTVKRCNWPSDSRGHSFVVLCELIL